jgi:hypothetical protein
MRSINIHLEKKTYIKVSSKAAMAVEGVAKASSLTTLTFFFSFVVVSFFPFFFSRYYYFYRR